MLFTALHRLLGRTPGPITDELLETAIAAGLAETDDLDWKKVLPEPKRLSEQDFPKDLAAMANSGGGIIVYGVEETQKRATGRYDVGELSERHEQALRAAAYSAISPPLLGLGIYPVGEDGNRAVVVVVPQSTDGPHLVFQNQFFGAPIRNNADTAWMKERQIEAAYRSRLDERRRVAQDLDALYDEAAVNWADSDGATFIAVARPRVPLVNASQPTRDEARELLSATTEILPKLVKLNVSTHPLASVDLNSPRPGLRRWVAIETAMRPEIKWRTAWVALHHDGSVSISAVVGGHPVLDRTNDGNYIEARAIECAVASFMAIVRAMGQRRGLGEFEARIGIESPQGLPPMIIGTVDNYGNRYDDSSIPFTRYSPVLSSIRSDTEDSDFHRQVRELAEDCVNQGGITNLNAIYSAPTESKS